MVKVTLAEKIRKIRKERRMNRRDLSNATQVSYHTLLAIELSRTKVPQVDTLVRIAKVYGIGMDELVKDTEFDPKNLK
jgi:transcriptional regulator with XRE-family HTH domain